MDIEALFELTDRGIPREQLLKMSDSRRKTLLEELKQQDKPQYSEQEAYEIIMKGENDLPALLRLHGVRCPESLKHDEQRKERLKYQLMGKTTDPGSLFELLSKIQRCARGFKQSCQSLEQIGLEVQDLVFGNVSRDVPRLKSFVMCDLPDCEETTRQTLTRLLLAEIPIIVTGEVCTGKSSFLNLLLEGTGIELPKNEQKTTSCICEFKYGDKRQAAAYPRSVRPGEDNPKIISDWTPEDLNHHINVGCQEQPGTPLNRKVEISAPIPLLKDGIVLVDTPGVDSGNEEVMQFLQEYLKSSAGFIYIINEARNVHKIDCLFAIEERIARRELANESSEELSSRLLRKTLFILNKYDTVEDKAIMLERVKDELKKHWLKNMSAENRQSCRHTRDISEPLVLPLSVTNDRDHLKAGYLSDRLENVVDSLQTIVSQNMAIQLRECWRWFWRLVSNTEYHAQQYLNAADRIQGGNETEVLTNLRYKCERLQKTGDEQTFRIQHYFLTIDLHEITEKLGKHLQSRSVEENVTDWKEEDCPGDKGSYEAIEAEAKRKLEERFQTQIENWERDNGLLGKKRMEIEKVVATLAKPFNRDVEVFTRNLDPSNAVKVDIPKREFTLLPKLGIFESVILLFERVFLHRPELEQRSRTTYLKQKRQCMVNVAKSILKQLRGQREVRNLVVKILGLREAFSKIQQVVQQDVKNLQARIEDLEKSEAMESLRPTYREIQTHCSELLDRLLAWELHHLFEGHDINNKNVVVKDRCLGSGRFARYHLGEMRKDGQTQQVTCKTYATPDDYRAINQDYKWLRNSNHTFIAKALGMIQSAPGQSQLTVVLEECKHSLYEWLTCKSHLGETGGDVSTILRIVSETCQALKYLHENGMVHGDLMPSTIMLATCSSRDPEPSDITCASDLIVKLCHSGVKEGTLVGDSLRLPMTPNKYVDFEVVTQRRYRPSADVYNVGIILWDMWYGPEDKGFAMTPKHVQIENQSSSSLTGFGFKASKYPSPNSGVSEQSTGTDSVGIGDRPATTSPPVGLYRRLMEDCGRKITDRPNINSVLQQLSNIIDSVARPYAH